MIVREERDADKARIAALTEEAFRGAAHTDGTEHAIPRKLREAGQLAVSLVADDDGELLGHVVFSPVAISDGSSSHTQSPMYWMPASFRRSGVS